MDEIFEQILSASSWGDGVGSAMLDVIGPLQNFAKMMPHSQEQLFDAHQDHLQPLNARGLARRSGESNGIEGPAFRQSAQALNLMGGPWQESFVGSARPMPGSQGRPGALTSLGDGMSDNVHLGKRGRSDDDISMSTDAKPQGSGDQAQSTITNGAAKPRVRARRGQATDPHSIAERNRRERIAERMKALQELVPDSNKTDKASMLDEIINYVKFLQMQVKCLSMCRLGGAGVAAPLLADLPAEGAANFIAANLAQANGAAVASQEGLAFAERQVARLMDEDMSAAMQYLQSKGLCLMPISLATAISSSGGARQQQQAIPSKSADASGGEKEAMELQALAASSGAALSGKDLDIKGTLVKNNFLKPSKEMLEEDGVRDKLGHGALAMKENDQR